MTMKAEDFVFAIRAEPFWRRDSHSLVSRFDEAVNEQPKCEGRTFLEHQPRAKRQKRRKSGVWGSEEFFRGRMYGIQGNGIEDRSAK